MSSLYLSTHKHYAFACILVAALWCCPQFAQASDIGFLAQNLNQSWTDTPMSIAPASASSPTGTWVTFLTSKTSGAVQTSEYYISNKANDDLSVDVTVKTTLTNINQSYVCWYTTKTIYDNGVQVAYIGPDYAQAGPGKSISQQTTFRVKNGGIHHITSVETTFRDNPDTIASWDFNVSIPYVIKASATEGGSISPSGTSMLEEGSSLSYNTSAHQGWRLKDVVVDGVSQGVISSYDFVDVRANHTIESRFQKTWNVTFVDKDGQVLDQQVVDDGGAATAPTIPDNPGYAPQGWDKPFSQVTSDLIIAPVYEAIIDIKVPTLLACSVLASGEVIAPSGYMITNDSVVPVNTTAISCSGLPEGAQFSLVDQDTPVYSTSEGGVVAIPASSSKELTWDIEALDPKRHADLLAQAVRGPVTFCTISYTFAQAV